MKKNEVIKSYKGFNKDLTCLGFQYEPGKTYTEDKADCCNAGFHACEAPLDVFRYYPPNSSRYFEVEQSGKISRSEDGDSKVASTQIKIGAEIGIPGIVKAQIEWVKAHTNNEHTDPKAATAGDRGAATAGALGAATAGALGAATAGYRGAATAGYGGAATAGDRGAATAGALGAATAGYGGAATAGDRGAATAGDRGAATAGALGAATSRGTSCVGQNGVAVARGNNVKVKGGIGALLVICEEETDSFDIKNWRAFIVDGGKIKEDTFYMLKDGELVEVEGDA